MDQLTSGYSSLHLLFRILQSMILSRGTFLSNHGQPEEQHTAKRQSECLPLNTKTWYSLLLGLCTTIAREQHYWPQDLWLHYITYMKLIYMCYICVALHYIMVSYFLAILIWTQWISISLAYDVPPTSTTGSSSASSCTSSWTVQYQYPKKSCYVRSTVQYKHLACRQHDEQVSSPIFRPGLNRVLSWVCPAKLFDGVFLDSYEEPGWFSFICPTPVWESSVYRYISLRSAVLLLALS
jgi:hypothetical protein